MLALLHNPPALSIMLHVDCWPMSHVAVFDTAFFHDFSVPRPMPSTATSPTDGIIRRYGDFMAPHRWRQRKRAAAFLGPPARRFELARLCCICGASAGDCPRPAGGNVDGPDTA